MLLVNKADLLTREQRRDWARHFEKEGLRAVFWSALAESNRLEAEEKVRRWRFNDKLCELALSYIRGLELIEICALFSIFRLAVAFNPNIKSGKLPFPQGMEVDDPECGESDPEEEEQPDNEDMSANQEEEGEESDIEEEQQEKIMVDEEEWHTCSEDEGEEEWTLASSNESIHNSSRLLHKDELLAMFKSVHSGPKCKEDQLTVGLVGKMYYLLSVCVQ